jgi:hypothetical protein
LTFQPKRFALITLLITISTFLFTNASVFDTHAQNSNASGGPGGSASATNSGSESYPCYGTCNYYNGPSATASGGPGGNATTSNTVSNKTQCLKWYEDQELCQGNNPTP